MRSLLVFVFVGSLALPTACARKEAPSPVTPAEPLPADPELQLETMEKECDAMIAALEAYKACEHHEDDDRHSLQAWIETANRNFAASRKANPEPNARKAIAGACRKATESVKAATIRCSHGAPPKQDDD